MAIEQERGRDERREGERHRSVLALGKIVHAGRERIGLVRDVSAGGARVEMADPPEPNVYVVVEMLGLNPTPARVAWRRNNEVGFAFRTAQDVDAMCRRGQDANGLIVRGPRFSVDRSARLRVAGKIVPVRVANISVGGARLEGVAGIDLHLPASIELDARLEPMPGYVRWASDGSAGFNFLPPLSLPRLIATVER